jgi:hypothetical protein
MARLTSLPLVVGALMLGRGEIDNPGVIAPNLQTVRIRMRSSEHLRNMSFKCMSVSGVPGGERMSA